MSAGHEKVHLTAEQRRELEEELESQLLRLERSMRVTEEGLRPVELDHTAVGRLSRIDELQIPFERLAVFPETDTCMDCGS